MTKSPVCAGLLVGESGHKWPGPPHFAELGQLGIVVSTARELSKKLVHSRVWGTQMLSSLSKLVEVGGSKMSPL